MDKDRLIQEGKENQADHAYATIISCSDSRVPVETIFDAGVMDIFVIRVAGNVCDTDEVGSIGYGLAHVKTPVHRAMEIYPHAQGDGIIPLAIEENVWISIRDLFMKSPATRDLVKNGTVKVVGAIYDVGTGKIHWLQQARVINILHEVGGGKSEPHR